MKPSVATQRFLASRAACSLRCESAHRRVLPRMILASGYGDLADGFIAEYDLAGIKLEPNARRQLRDWYGEELRRACPETIPPGLDDEAHFSTLDAPGSKALPPLIQRRPGIPQLRVLWDLESVKPFTQQHRGEHSGDSGQQQRPRSGAASGRPSRLVAAGLPGTASAPDLIGALDQLYLTLKSYGNIHAIHLFLRESTLAKAPVLHRQVEQLRTWVGLQDESAGQEEQTCSGDGPSGDGAGSPDSATHNANRPAGLTAGSNNEAEGATESGRLGRGRVFKGRSLRGVAGQRRLSSLLLQGDDLHDCPMCRSAYPSRLDLLRHFAMVHQGPLLAATAVDTRTHIMWTRGRTVGLRRMAAPEDPGGAGTAAALDDSTTEKVMVSPQEFVYARNLLMHGRHLDELLASRPLVVHSMTSEAFTRIDATRGPPSLSGHGQLDSRPVKPLRTGGTHDRSKGIGDSGSSSSSSSSILSAAEGSGSAISKHGLHLHLIPAGQPAESAAEALHQVAEALAAQQPAAVSSSLLARRGDRSPADKRAQQGRGRNGANKARMQDEAESVDAPTPCFCVVSDAEELDKIFADLRQRGFLGVAITRVTRVPSADVSLRWWAVQGGEYRLAAGS